MKIDTPAKYKALQKRRQKVYQDNARDYGDIGTDRKGRKQQFVIVPGKPNHEARAMDKGFAPLMTKPVVPGWFARTMGKETPIKGVETPAVHRH